MTDLAPLHAAARRLHDSLAGADGRDGEGADGSRAALADRLSRSVVRPLAEASTAAAVAPGPAAAADAETAVTSAPADAPETSVTSGAIPSLAELARQATEQRVRDGGPATAARGDRGVAGTRLRAGRCARRRAAAASGRACTVHRGRPRGALPGRTPTTTTAGRRRSR